LEGDGGLIRSGGAVRRGGDHCTDGDRAYTGVNDELIAAEADLVGITAEQGIGHRGGGRDRGGEGIGGAKGHELRGSKAEGGGGDINQLKILGVMAAGAGGGVGKSHIEAVVDEVGPGAVGGPDVGSGIIGQKILHIVIPAPVDAEIVEVRPGNLGVQVEGRRHIRIGQMIVVHEGKDHAVGGAAPGLTEVLDLSYGEHIGVIPAIGLFLGEKVHVLAHEGRGGQAGPVNPAVKILKPPFVRGAIAPNGSHVVVDLEVRNVLAEVLLILGNVV